VLDEFIRSHREAIIASARARVATRTSPRPTDAELTNGIPLFIDQLVDALHLARSSAVADHSALSESARKHGRELLREGLTIGEVVHVYGAVGECITNRAVEQKLSVSANESRVLTLCLDDAIAGAVTEYALQRERAVEAEGTERLGILAHELRNVLNTGSLAYGILQTGQVAIGGSTGQLLGRSLVHLARLIDRSLAEVRLDAGIARVEQIDVEGFVEEIEIGASVLAKERGIQLVVPRVEVAVTVEGDRQILASALSNLLQNAFKFTRKGSVVSLTTHATAERVRFDVGDECGGLPAGKVEELFAPFSQRGSDRSGVGLGLPICLKAAKAHGGEIRVRDLPGTGCVFTLDVPRRPPTLSVVAGGKSAAGSPGGGRSADGTGPAKARTVQSLCGDFRIPSVRNQRS
jgi:signal transduction histidine kinase